MIESSKKDERTPCFNCNDSGWYWDGTGEFDEGGDEIEALETPCWNCGVDATKETNAKPD